MVYLVAIQEDKYLIFDENKKELQWINEKPQFEADRKMLQTILNSIIYNTLAKTPNNIVCNYIEPEEVEIKASHVFINSWKCQVNKSIKKYELNSLYKNGGAVIFYTDDNERYSKEKNLLKVIPNFNQSIKNGIYSSKTYDRNQREYSSSQENNIDYIEAVVKIPKIDNLDKDTLRRIMDSNITIYKKVQDISSKLDAFQENTSQNEKTLNFQLEEYRKINEMLLKERNLLEKEIEYSEKKALQTLKEKLKLSKAALNRIVDLDMFDSEVSIKKIIISILESQGLSEKEIEDCFSDERNKELILSFSDNIDAKVQSLQEVKKDFLNEGILKG